MCISVCLNTREIHLRSPSLAVRWPFSSTGRKQRQRVTLHVFYEQICLWRYASTVALLASIMYIVQCWALCISHKTGARTRHTSVGVVVVVIVINIMLCRMHYQTTICRRHSVFV